MIANPRFNILGSNSRFFIVTGGRGSAKSFTVGTFATMLSREVGHKILFTRQTMTSAHLSIIPEFKEKIDLLNLSSEFNINKAEIVNKASKSEILFRGIKTSSGDQTANLKSLQGVTTWIVDEAEELTDEKTFDKINLSIRQKGKQNRVILILNPATKEHWIYKRFFEEQGVNPGFTGVKGDTTYLHTTYLDNIKNLDESFISDVEKMRDKNPLKYQHQILGGWLDKAEGVILSNWSMGTFQEVGKVVFGQDYGFSVDPTTLVKTSIDKANKKIYVKLLLYKPSLTTSQIAEINLRECGTDLIYGDSAEPRLIKELKDLGCKVKDAVKGQGSITAGIAVLQDYHLVIDPDSRDLIKELNNYVWNDKKSGTPIDDYNHAIDALRYAIYSQLSNKFKFHVA